MHVIGIIAEYNPFHNGHLYQIKKIKEKYPESIIIAVVSSFFTQRGDISILNKWDKTNIILENGIDLVVELPFVYATQSSDIFAQGAISIIEKLKVDTIIFGTESDSLEEIEKIADLQLNNPKYDYLVKKYLQEGLNYPTATNKAIYKLINSKIESPNDLLALSYIKEIKAKKINIIAENIKRTNNYHSNEIINNIASASYIRSLFNNNKNIDKLIPYSVNKLIKVNMEKAFPYLKYKILSEEKNLNLYQTVDEGIENRIIKVINKSNTYEELINNIKSKRYTYNKISRMLLHIFTNFTKEEAAKIKIDYIHILGFNIKGKEYLNKIKKNIDIPIVIGYKKNISKVLDKEIFVAKLYYLLTGEKFLEKEYHKKPIIKE